MSGVCVCGVCVCGLCVRCVCAVCVRMFNGEGEHLGGGEILYNTENK